MHAPRSRISVGNALEPSNRNSTGSESEERVLEITQHAKRSIQILVSDRDSMTSDLIANAMGSDRNREAASISSAHLMQELAKRKVDVVVIGADQRFRSGDGFDLASAVSRIYPRIMIIIILNHSNPESVIQAFRSGARGVFSRHQPMSDLLSGIDHVWNGQIWAGAPETTWLLDAFKSIPSPNLVSGTANLTPREFEVVQHAAKGKTNKAIATGLGLSEHTVKNHMFRAFDKLGVSNRNQLLFYLTMRGNPRIAEEIGNSREEDVTSSLG